MRVGEHLNFVPGVPFSALDLDGPDFLGHFKTRMCRYFITPALVLADKDYEFTAGLLLVSAIDALARLQYGERYGNKNYTGTDDNGETYPKTKQRFQDWVRQELVSFPTQDRAERFYEDFRCGLVHEARVKNASEFSTEQDQTVNMELSIMSVNPRLLAAEVEEALSRFIMSLERDIHKRQRFVKTFSKEFLEELEAPTRTERRDRSARTRQAS